MFFPAFTARRSDRARKTAARRRTLFALEGLETRQVLSTFTWAAAADAAWSTPNSWLKDGIATSSLPGASDDVVFDATSSSSATVSASTTVKSITIASNYAGTLALNANLAGGVFDQEGGTFTANSNTLTTGQKFTVNGGSFNAGTGTVVFAASSTFYAYAPGVPLYNVTVATGGYHFYIGTSSSNLGSLDVNGKLTLTSYNSFNGTVYAGDDVTTTVPVAGNSGSGLLVIDGAGNQALTGSDGAINGRLPSVQINKSSGVLSLANTVAVQGGWVNTKGSVDAGSSTVKMIYSGTVDTGSTRLNNLTFATAANIGVKRLDVKNLAITSVNTLFYTGGGGSGAITVSGDLSSTYVDTHFPMNIGTVNITMITANPATITATGDFPLGGIIINKGSSAVVTANVTKPLVGPLSLVNLGVLKGTFQVAGNVTTSDTGVSGNADGTPVLVFMGGGNQTLTAGAANAQVPGLEFNKSGGSFGIANNGNASGANALVVTGGWIVDATNNAPVNLNGANIKFMLSGGYGHRTIDTGASAGFGNVELATGSGSTVTIPGSGQMVVNGLLTISNVGTIVGTIDARNDVTTSDTSVSSGPGVILFNGTGDQTLSATALTSNGQLPSVTINKASGTLYLAGPQTIGVTGDWTYTKGTVGTTGSTVAFQGYGSRTVDTGGGPVMSFNNVEITKGSGDTLKIANALGVYRGLKINGSLTINQVGVLDAGLGKITVGGDLTSKDTYVGGAADITLVNSSNVKITGGDFPIGGIIIDKSSTSAVTAAVTTPLRGPLSLVNQSALTGTFQVAGNVTTSDDYAGLAGNPDGTPVLIFKGTGNQTLTAAVPNAQVPGLKFDKTGGSFTLANNTNISGDNALIVNGGWIVAPTNTRPVNLSDVSNVKFDGGVDRTIDTGNSAGFTNVELAIGSSKTATITKMNVTKNLTVSNVGAVNGADIHVWGDVIAKKSTYGDVAGTSNIVIDGTGNQTLRATGDDARILGIIIDKKGHGLLTIDPTYAIDVTGDWKYIGIGPQTIDVKATGSTIKFIGGDKTIQSGDMIFGNVIVAIGSANKMSILDANGGPDGTAYFYSDPTKGSYTKTSGTIITGSFVPV